MEETILTIFIGVACFLWGMFAHSAWIDMREANAKNKEEKPNEDFILLECKRMGKDRFFSTRYVNINLIKAYYYGTIEFVGDSQRYVVKTEYMRRLEEAIKERTPIELQRIL